MRTPKKELQFYPQNPKLQNLFAGHFGLSLVTAQLLINRGLHTLKEAEEFLNLSLQNLPDPFLLPDMEKGVERILKAVEKKEKIAVYGDYDVDGLTSTALLSLFFKELGIPLTTYIPDRIKEGYGVNIKALEKLKKQGIDLVLTVDCGTKSFEASQWAKENGLDLLITDHHIVDGPIPPAVAFINPQRGGENAPGKELAGCGVVFFLLIALRKKMRLAGLFSNGEPNLKQFLDLVALGTVSDLVPLTGLNRTLTFFGLLELAKTKRAGLIALKEAASLTEETAIQPSDIGFRLGPRLNAGGRIAQASLGLNLLCSQDMEAARKLAKILNQCNVERQALQEQHLGEALGQAGNRGDRFGFVLSSRDWHPGLVGLVASKIAQNFYRPAIALSLDGDLARGSARSIPGINISEILKDCSPLLEHFGGHHAAAGLTLKMEKLKLFEERFEELLKEKFKEMPPKPTLMLDGELKLGDINKTLLDEFEKLKPFGIQNPEPLFFGRELKFSDPRIVGKDHIKLKVLDQEKSSFDAIGFNLAKHHPFKKMSGDLLFLPEWNSYLGAKNIQLRIKEIQIS